MPSKACRRHLFCSQHQHVFFSVIQHFTNLCWQLLFPCFFLWLWLSFKQEPGAFGHSFAVPVARDGQVLVLQGAPDHIEFLIFGSFLHPKERAEHASWLGEVAPAALHHQNFPRAHASQSQSDAGLGNLVRSHQLHRATRHQHQGLCCEL